MPIFVDREFNLFMNLGQAIKYLCNIWHPQDITGLPCLIMINLLLQYLLSLMCAMVTIIQITQMGNAACTHFTWISIVEPCSSTSQCLRVFTAMSAAPLLPPPRSSSLHDHMCFIVCNALPNFDVIVHCASSTNSSSPQSPPSVS